MPDRSNYVEPFSPDDALEQPVTELNSGKRNVDENDIEKDPTSAHADYYNEKRAVKSSRMKWQLPSIRLIIWTILGFNLIQILLMIYMNVYFLNNDRHSLLLQMENDQKILLEANELDMSTKVNKRISVTDIALLPISQDDKRRIIAMANAAYPGVFPTVENVKFMFFSPIWLPLKKFYLSVVRVYILDRASVLYASAYNENWTEILDQPMIYGRVTLPTILDIPFDHPVSKIYSGPEDPRIFRDEASGKVMIIYNRLKADDTRRMHLFSFYKNQEIELKIDTTSYSKLPYESGFGKHLQSFNYNPKLIPRLPKNVKNWSPIVHDGKLYLIYNHNGPIVLNCQMENGLCAVQDDYKGEFNSISCIRGGSGYIPIPLTSLNSLFKTSDEDFFLSFAFYHSTKLQFYRPVMIIMAAPKGQMSKAKIIFCSTALELDGFFYKPPLQPANKKVKITQDAHIAMIVSISRWEIQSNNEEDALTVSLNFQDEKKAIFTLKGVMPFLNQIIGLYKLGLLAFTDSNKYENSPLSHAILRLDYDSLELVHSALY